MRPVYRAGDRIMVQPTSEPRRGDRVVVKTLDGEVMAKEVARITGKRLELTSLNPDYPGRVLERRDIAWIARILWASQ
jgi:phage repressor protein C with HTH and peptisase S24 domain